MEFDIVQEMQRSFRALWKFRSRRWRKDLGQTFNFKFNPMTLSYLAADKIKEQLTLVAYVKTKTCSTHHSNFLSHFLDDEGTFNRTSDFLLVIRYFEMLTETEVLQKTFQIMSK